MEALKRRRSIIKGLMTRIVSFADAIETSTKVDDIKARLDKTSELWSDFVQIENLMFEQSADAVSQMNEFEENYYHAVALLNAGLRHFHTANQCNNSGILGETAFQSHSSSNEAKLPRLNIPIFSGDLQEWQSFFDLFNCSVHEKVSLSAAQKLQYLKGLLKGEPLGLIKHLNITDANYIEAYQILVKRYDKKKLTITSYIETFIKQSPITRITASNIRKMADTTEEIIRGLKAIGTQGDARDPWLIYILVNKLDDDSRQFWQHESVKIEYPTIQNFIDCLQTRAETLEGIGEIKPKPVPRMAPYTRVSHIVSASNVICPLCKIEHMLFTCPRFKDMTITDRRSFIKNESRCYNCLSNSHIVKFCRSKRSCRICRGRHNSLLHSSNESNPQNVPPTSTLTSINNIQSAPNISSDLQSTLSAINPTSSPKPSVLSISNTPKPVPSQSIHVYKPDVQSYNTATITDPAGSPIEQELKPNTLAGQSLLPTAIVHVADANGVMLPCRILLDSGSQASFVTEKYVRKLGLPRQRSAISIKGVGSSNGEITRGSTKIQISSRFNRNPRLVIHALILPTITVPMPQSTFNPDILESLQHLQLADPTCYKTSEIDMLIGIEHFFEILLDGKVTSGPGQPIAQNTIFGWVIAGNINEPGSIYSGHIRLSTEVDVDRSLRKFWEIEEIPATKYMSEEEKLCEIHYEETSQRNEDGRFIVKLPFKHSSKPLGDSRQRAVQRLLALESKFARCPDIKPEYVNFMREYLKLGHMERIAPSIATNRATASYYMPHHAVIKRSSTTTRLRVVFDASAKSTTNVSLNENLMVGPTVQDSLYAILIRFRRHSIVFTSDIEKMYRQILIAREDAEYQRIVWRETPESPIEDYRLLTVTYGTAAAPYLATKTLTTIADENVIQFPAASKIIRQDLYVDDLMSGANSEEEALKLQGQIIEIFESSGFHLRKWSSNCTALLDNIPETNRELSAIEITEGSRSIKLLGLIWCPNTDNFHFKVSIHQQFSNTKRTMLSEASKIFDPLGWLSPITIKVKILFQSLWLFNLHWDDPLPTQISKKWYELRQEMIEIERISIPRWLFTGSEHFQLHGFSDSSEFAYSAVIYCRTETKTGTIRTNLVCAKTRVAPIKHTSIPRLELCGALLLSRLMKTVIEALQSKDVETFYWTDSTNVLWWLSSPPRCWKGYVANRTAEILESTSRTNWHHVPTKQNPADCASRGMLPSTLRTFELWWKGPTWLIEDPNSWPNQNHLLYQNPQTNEEKAITKTKLDAIISNQFLCQLADRYSKFSKLVRIIALLNHFHNNIKKSMNNEPKSNLLSPDDYKKAQHIIFKWVQADSCNSDIVCIRNKQPLAKHSKLVALNPFIDDQGLLRVGSRIRHANIDYNKRFPIILPAKHIITDRIIEETHMKYLHAAQSLMVNTLRQRYWILNCKNLVRQMIHRCIQCTRYKPQQTTQLMGDLPSARVNYKYIFNQTGVDYAGPIWLRSMVGRRSKPHKGYIAIFVCMSSKAVHIELVSDLSTNAFLAALKRFMSRRGVCSDLFSDNGTNFVGARNQLQEIYNSIKSIKHNEIVSNFLLDFQTKWHFSPPAGPNFGGLYESAVKATKFHLRRVLGNTILNFEEMSTLLSQIEAILNSRPLCSLSSSSDDLDMLTPAHYILGHPLLLPPETDYTMIKHNTINRWHLIQKLMQHFWNRFYSEYLTTLHNRSKWQRKNKNVNIDDIILIRDDNTHPAQWPLGKIVQIHPGRDGLVRVVSIKTKAGICKRPITKVVLLPVS